MFICTGSKTEIQRDDTGNQGLYHINNTDRKAPLKTAGSKHVLHKDGALVSAPIPASQPGHFRIMNRNNENLLDLLDTVLAIRCLHLHANF